jgi:hypothetical protein
MEYHGKLYGKLGLRQYFETGKTSEDFDNMQQEINALKELADQTAADRDHFKEQLTKTDEALEVANNLQKQYRVQVNASKELSEARERTIIRLEDDLKEGVLLLERIWKLCNRHDLAEMVGPKYYERIKNHLGV